MAFNVRFLRLGQPKPPVLSLQQGFALPMSLAIGMVMVALAGASVLVAQKDRDGAVQRRTSGASQLVSDSAVSRAMLQLSQPNNSILLVRDYDPIDPKTGRNYLGADGVVKSGDETGRALDEWTGYNPSGAPCFQQMGRSAPQFTLTGNIGANESYRILAYRYDQQQRLGTVLIEGIYQGQSSWVAVTLSIEPVLDKFPGVLLYNSFNALGTLALRGRQILGTKGNVYYAPVSSGNPALTGFSKPGEATRPSYLDALYASPAQDGASGDSVAGAIFGCRLSPNIPPGIMGTNFGLINNSQTLRGVGGTVTTLYRVDTIDLSGSETLTVDTTGGPVQIDITDKGNSGLAPERAITLRQAAKIINVRTDGQPPRVGDLRIMMRGNSQVNLYDKTCIQNAFLYIPTDEIRFLTSDSGCPGGQNTNFEGVIWAEEILSSKNAASNRPIDTYTGGGNTEFETMVTPGATSGIAVPEDVSSLADLLEYVDWPAQYRYGSIKNWQRVN